MTRLWNDFPTVWGLQFQDTATTVADGIFDLNHKVAFYLIFITIIVGYVLAKIIGKIGEEGFQSKYFTHWTNGEIAWTLYPAVILIIIAIPSYILLYLADGMVNPQLTIKAIASQWFWTYEFQDTTGKNVTFDSYMVSEDDLKMGEVRYIQVDNPLVCPVDTSIRIIVTSQDVIHNFAIPSLGIKMDATPGRLSEINIYVKRVGTFAGQCYELCGPGHPAMPILLKVVTFEDYVAYLNTVNDD